MNQSLVLLHEESLQENHPATLLAPANSQVIFVWDDKYFQEQSYSLKRLVFIFESLCELGIDIIYGDTLQVVKDLKPSLIVAPAAFNPNLSKLLTSLSAIAPTKVVECSPFVDISHDQDFRRFSSYWKKAETSAHQPRRI